MFWVGISCNVFKLIIIDTPSRFWIIFTLVLFRILQHCHKIGEGVYGEVFLLRNPKGGTSVMKIIPIEGNLIVNGDQQKKYEEILSEIIIAV